MARFTSSAWVHTMPWGPPAVTSNWAPVMSVARRFPVALRGRMRSCNNVGTCFSQKWLLSGNPWTRTTGVPVP
jgi:hypothetical protein